jgi:hypothetical protein
MTMDRRGFLYAGGVAAAAGGAMLSPAPVAAANAGRSVTDFGVEPNSDRDQTEALQKAITELSRAGQAVFLPGGRYVVGELKLPETVAILGTPHLTVIRSEHKVLAGTRLKALHLSGIIFERSEHGKTGVPVIEVSGADVSISHCAFTGGTGTGLRLENCSGNVSGVDIESALASGISATGAAGLTISGCRIGRCKGAGIAVSGSAGDVQGFAVSQNQVAGCGIGIAADGVGIVAGNVVTGATGFGLKIGNARSSGHALVQGNLIRDSRIGIGVAASGDDIMASLNMITGAKDGAIRAFDGEKIVGPDLARQSAEAYLNLMVAGNVVR